MKAPDFLAPVAKALEEGLDWHGQDAARFAAESSTSLGKIVTDFLAAPSADHEYVIAHARARLAQLAAIHLIRQDAKARQRAIEISIAVLRGALVVLAAAI